MRSFQFWTLVLGATLVSLLMFKNILLTRHLNQQERLLIESQQMASAAPEYENAWKTLAMHIYQSSRTDPALAAVLKNAAVQVRSEESTTPAADGTAPSSTPTPATATAPAVPAKGPTTTP